MGDLIEKDSSYVLYEKFGFEIILLEKKHGIDIFEMLLPKDLHEHCIDEFTVLQRREKLKQEIRHAVLSDHFNSVGIFKDGKLIGLSFNSFKKEVGHPWLGQMYVKPDFRKTKAPLVLMNYLLNHLYKGYTMRMRTSNVPAYNKHIRNLPIYIGYSVFKKGFSERVLRASGENDTCQH